MPRYLKIQEFVAHQGSVNCIKIGRKSSGVLVTGGDDKKVNLWTIGTQTRTLSLHGHQSPVESVTFDNHEEVVAAGAASGSIKVFDLDQAKVTRALNGHKSNVLSLEFGNLGLLSGSMDTNIKLWDLRTKEAVHTFKGNKAGVTHVHFSPDSKWVASGAMDGSVKIYDVGTQRVIQEFSQHTHAITGLEFHPQEYLMASSSADKTVKVWDLETMGMIAQTPPETTGVRSMTFHPDGTHLFSAVQDGLRVWQWEPPPPLQHDNVDVPWSKVADIAVMKEKNKLVGCSFNQSFVGLWVVDLKEVRPFGGPSVNSSADAGGLAVRGAGNRLVARGDSGAASRYQHLGSGGSAAASPTAAAVEAARTRETLQARCSPLHDFAMRRQHGSQEAVPGSIPSSLMAAAREPLPSSSAERVRPIVPPFPSASGAGSRYPPPEVATPLHPPPLVRPLSVVAPGDAALSPGPSAAALAGLPPQAPASTPVPPDHHRSTSPGSAGKASVGVGVGDSLLRNQPDIVALQREARQVAAAEAAAASHAAATPTPFRHASELARQASGASRNGARGPVGISGGAVRRSSRSTPTPPPGGLQGDPDLDAISQVVAGSDSTKATLLGRLNGLQAAQSLLGRGDLRAAAMAARRHNDPAMAADMLQAAIARKGFGELLTLDSLPDLCPVLESVLALQAPLQVEVALDTISLICHAYVSLILDHCGPHAAVPRMPDLNFDLRKEKCELARVALRGLHTKLLHLAHVRGGGGEGAGWDLAGLRAKDLASQLSACL
uniref:Katanin p80 WD40 repeat-containing subunit B1 homolog n=1 Tax=Dunaliella tertiolecta TaxID=3047 RepID=A0A7S3R0F2_DUNTE|mmetsp:Transcript_14282/g.38733  ORF Transcript_14282/g.38733 Transcript_14282/m.38733 type:complete len:775 (+) Transcript_14282:133-2457(+)|eukprot:CAMPEP_0202382432 /NCGR_PEP_ID=MMETSP1127-20130417/43161_1 /ASSEMBLY_ACC=CAM_ASM_000462 /TAXON_ID=3047 /ORGANISM="Dunaliella tertiolecta, Strain CCMP1320" /LENGTH=774 /DNA_ID=CAMNT_0048981635 /DNA_START=77 /DNA_END=2401 /DNA_ORIENTATION=-